MEKLRIGFTEAHGMAKELCDFPPDGVEYSFLRPGLRKNRFLRSPIKGYFGHYRVAGHDLIEAILSPVFTDDDWIYSLANFHEAVAFNILGLPLPRAVRVQYLKSLLLRDNFKRLIFWSEAGRKTLAQYSSDPRLTAKATVVYPAIRTVTEELIRHSEREVTILFTGDFFRKGGVNVLDAFERAQRLYPSARLVLCCDERIDFNTENVALKQECLRRIKENSAVTSLGRVPRERLLNSILPETDIYLLPTYAEAFGFAILEAMAYGIPVISTDLFAIPEIVEDGICGFLLDTSAYDCEKMFRSYTVNDIPAAFRTHITENLFDKLCLLLESPALRKSFGRAGVEIARTKFSFESRNKKMLSIYRESR